jgi:hypothetical protein
LSNFKPYLYDFILSWISKCLGWMALNYVIK